QLRWGAPEETLRRRAAIRRAKQERPDVQRPDDERRGVAWAPHAAKGPEKPVPRARPAEVEQRVHDASPLSPVSARNTSSNDLPFNSGWVAIISSIVPYATHLPCRSRSSSI